MGKTATTSANSRRAQEYSANAVSAGISFIPVVGQVYDVFTAISMLIDVYDPYGYGTIVRRSGVDTQLEMINGMLKDELDGSKERITQEVTIEVENTLATLEQDAKASNSEFTPKTPEQKKELVDKIVKSVLSGFFATDPNVPSECYSDLPSSLSGPPLSTCNSQYQTDYKFFIDSHREDYKAMEYMGEKEFVDQTLKNNIEDTRTTITDTLNAQRMNLLKLFGLLVIILIFLFF